MKVVLGDFLRKVSLKELELLLADWQQRLRMLDWDITLKLIKFNPDDPYVARAVYDPQTELAIIEICDPRQMDNVFTGTPDTEVALVHELLHVKMSRFDMAFKKSNPLTPHLEVMVEEVAQTLVDAKRGHKNSLNYDFKPFKRGDLNALPVRAANKLALSVSDRSHAES
jgi:hypothetical protein